MKNFCFALCVIFVMGTNKMYAAEGGMPQLNTEFWPAQIFWLILIFSSLYVIIWKIFLPRITDSIENRKSRIVNDLNETQKLKESAEKKLVEYTKAIEDAKKEAKKIIEDSKKKIENNIKNKKGNCYPKSCIYIHSCFSTFLFEISSTIAERLLMFIFVPII